MTIRDVEVFRAVMKNGTASQAALTLGISQPGVSQSLRKLEDMAGVRLFERVRGRLVPTQEAYALMSDISRYFVGYDLIERRIRSIASYGMGRVSVASTPELGRSLIPRAIARFNAAAREVQVSVDIRGAHEVRDAVATGQATFGLHSEDSFERDESQHVFVDAPLVAVMNEGNRLARLKHLDVKSLDGLAYISLDDRDGTQLSLQTTLEQLHVNVRLVVETTCAQTACELVLAGIGVSIVDAFTAMNFQARGLVIKPMSINLSKTIFLASRPSVALGENELNFLQCLRAQAIEDQNQISKLLGHRSNLLQRKKGAQSV